MDEFTIKIPIPTDEDGYILFKCPKCGTFFMLMPEDVEDDTVIDIYCPLCGLISQNYLADDVLELAKARSINYALNGLFNEFKKLDRRTNNSPITVKVNKPKKQDENPIRSCVNAMEIIEFECCNKCAKISDLLAFCGSYCPYCGGLRDGINEN